MEDRYDIMKWRNEQIYHLRQDKPLTKDAQDQYFSNVVLKLFDQEQPNQILFTYLKDSKCIGYGGLVHINWVDKNAEISFIMDTALEKEHFEFHWTTYLGLIEQLAFEELNFHKIFTYAFDLRPRLYSAMAKSGFKQEAVLREHSFFDGKYIDVVIHAKIYYQFILREATSEDLDVTYQWANDKTVRAFAYNQIEIAKEAHTEWFKEKLRSNACAYYILEANNKKAGSIRFDIEENQRTAKISYLIDSQSTGKGFGTYLLERGVAKLLNDKPDLATVYGFVLKDNKASIKIFKKAKYEITFESETELKFERRLK
jgi:RimJ/RimL family protein N-acetyltransferase